MSDINITKEELTFSSRDGETTCHAYVWKPMGNIKGILLISHGMTEHMGRYDELAQFFVSNGFLVAGNDHLGHGATAVTPSDLGYFCKRDPGTVLVRDVHRLKKTLQQKYPGVPFFLLGHSMGSFIARKYMTMYGKGIDGIIIVGTGNQPGILTGFGKFFCNVIGLFCGQHHRSKFLTKLAFGSYLKRIPNPQTTSDWLSHDEEIIRRYKEDPLCTYTFTVNGYHTLFDLISFVSNRKVYEKVRKDLPVLIASGKEDPVGHYGKDPEDFSAVLKEYGFSSVDLKLYPDMRHEIHNETGREAVYKDLLDWVLGLTK